MNQQNNAQVSTTGDIPVVSVKNLTVAYNKRPVLWDIAVDLPQGKVIAIIGPNGAGKSTFIKSLLRLVPAVSGTVKFFGEDYDNTRSRISYMPQRTNIDWDFPITVLELVTMGIYKEIGWYKRVRTIHKKKIGEALEKVGMLGYAKRQISQLSGGQQQRTFMARALVEDSDLYFMDEPFAGIDAATERSIFSLLQELKEHHKTIVIVHHNLDMIKEYFDFVAMMNLRLIASGPIEETFTEENLVTTYRGRLTLLDYAAGDVIKKG